MRLEIADNYDRLLRERLIELVSPSLSVTKLPETELARLKKLVVDEVNSCFADYGYYYGIETIDEFAVFWLGLEAGADWMAEVDRYATDKIKQTLVLYAIAENEAITVSETRFAEVLNKLAEENHLPQIEIIRRGGADVVYDEAIFLAVTDLLIARATVDNGELPLDND
jgi:FKBP-type peptidyl-prolyl cis-trans isomerase (trigger factor)